ncbi:hypothetical protein [Trueperella bialowiezensis]|uniref:hypothetical protein n=1 Tax=Trueperella bialowiezensis TaxID=312285 RepID=UPI000F83E0C2|nr:hypothetical protein [Trueperella bialowiezensis]
MSALESVSVDELCRSYAFQHAGALPGALPNWQMSGPLAEYCMNRGSEPAAEPDAGEEEAEAAVPVVSAADVGFYVRDHAQTIIDGGVLTFQPASGEVLVNKDVYFASSARPYEAAVNVLGVSATLRFMPVGFQWWPGDGTSLSTVSPGGVWPDGDVRAIYRAPGVYRPGVRIGWRVEVRTDGSDWFTVPGLGYTATYGNELTAIEAEAILVPVP